MPVPFFARLRQNYPDADLSTYLLTVHKDAYVVQAVVRQNSKILGSALAADSSIETAEDRACQRLLVHLGLTDAEAATSAIPAKSAAAPNTQQPPPLANPKSMNLAPKAEPSSSPPKERQLTPTPTLLSSEANFQPVQASSQGEDSQEAKTGTSDEATANIEPQARTTPAKPPAQTNPVDLSDIIIQTDFELRRLGWGVSQGRDFLERTYGKRSRHDLTDEELLEFLLYLESQPTPNLR